MKQLFPSKKKKNPTIVLHPQAQLLITGKPITPEQAQEVIAFTKVLSFDGWCSSDGSIGHIDAIKPNTNFDIFWMDLQELSKKFSFLDIGMSVMSGPPGKANFPLVSFHIQENTLKRSDSAHLHHPPPKRVRR